MNTKEGLQCATFFGAKMFFRAFSENAREPPNAHP